MKGRVNYRNFYLLLFLCNLHLFSQNELKEDVQYKLTVIPPEDNFIYSEGSQTIEMVTRDGKKYLCALPQEETKETSQKKEEKPAAQLAEEIVQTILQKNAACIYTQIQSGWWTYEFCYNKHVRQYHMEQTLVTAEYYLGYKIENTSPIANDKSQSLPLLTTPNRQNIPYYPHLFVDGTICDLTHTKRSIEVRYFCSDKSRSFIEDVKEPSSCNYSVNVNLRELCDFPLFQPKSTVKTVFCQLN